MGIYNIKQHKLMVVSDPNPLDVKQTPDNPYEETEVGW